MIAKCSCNNCGSHISFEIEGFQPGTRVQCPHCHMETLLFIPPAINPDSKVKKSYGIPILVFGIIVAACAMAAFLLPKAHQETKEVAPENLKPVVAAFGWKLGDTLAAQYTPRVHDGIYDFKPEAEVPPFYDFQLYVLDDGRIYSVKAEGSPKTYEGSQEDFYDCKKRLISVLSEKYGLRQHVPKELMVGVITDDEYKFGAEGQTVWLGVSSKFESFTIEYYDDKLQSIAFNEGEAKRQKVDEEKKAALSKRL